MRSTGGKKELSRLSRTKDRVDLAGALGGKTCWIGDISRNV